MLKKEPLIANRTRKICGPFGWIPREFITLGCIKRCSREELILYLFLVVVGDRNGLSFYGEKRICELLDMDLYELKESRRGLENKSYIKYDKPLYQVLSLPEGVIC